MKKDLIPVIIIGILALLGLFVIKETMIKGQSSSNEPSHKSSNPGKIAVEKNVISDNSASIRYEIDAAYPEVTGLHNTDAQKMINEQSYNLVESSINKFKNDLSKAQQVKGIPKSVFDQTSELTISYAVGQADNKIVSYHFSIMESVIGMAHPANTNRTLNFDAQTGKQLLIEDLFQPNKAFMTTIGDITQKQLSQRFAGQPGAEIFIRDGASPVTPHYDNFLVTPEGLQIIFDPATVAPDFTGTQTVTIPWNKLSSILNTTLISSN